MVGQIFPITLSGAEVRRKGKRLMGPLDLAVHNSGFTMVLGPNGAGKTTLLRSLHAMERLSFGTRSWAMAQAEACRHQAFVFQTPILLRRTVLDNLIFPLRLAGVAKPSAVDQANGWLERVNLKDASGRRASDLSGGERQKLALARALITKPQLLLLDEPTSALDGRATREIEAILTETYQAGTRILMSTHNLAQVRRLASDIIFIYRGKILEQTTAEQFLDDPQTAEGRAFVNGDILE